MKKYMKVFLITAIYLIANCMIAGNVQCQDGGGVYVVSSMEEAFTAIKSPEELAAWLSGNFRYQMKFPDNPQTPRQVLSARSGDCDDFANLSSAILSNMKVSNKVLILKFRGLAMRHAICIFKDANGYYSFISNKELVRTGESSMEGAVKKLYPDCEEIKEADAYYRYA